MPPLPQGYTEQGYLTLQPMGVGNDNDMGGLAAEFLNLAHINTTQIDFPTGTYIMQCNHMSNIKVICDGVKLFFVFF